ncbi:MAG: hypothetical protein AB1351_09425 [Thermoproteota archaeon]
MTKVQIDAETRVFQNEIIRLLTENNAIMKSNYTILQSLNENVRKILVNTN